MEYYQIKLNLVKNRIESSQKKSNQTKANLMTECLFLSKIKIKSRRGRICPEMI